VQQLPPINDLREIAEVAAKSGFYKGIGTTEKALAKMLYGWELGLPPMASLTAIYVMQNKEGVVLSQPTISAAAMATLIMKGGYKLKNVVHNGDESKIEIYDRDGSLKRAASFTWNHAEQAGLTTGPNATNYNKYPSNMLWSRNISNIAKQDCSDVFGGTAVYTPEEMDIPVDADGNALDGAEYAPREKSLRQHGNEELAERGEPPMPTREEAKEIVQQYYAKRDARSANPS
jgi:hypothetical protein